MRLPRSTCRAAAASGRRRRRAPGSRRRCRGSRCRATCPAVRAAGERHAVAAAEADERCRAAGHCRRPTTRTWSPPPRAAGAGVGEAGGAGAQHAALDAGAAGAPRPRGGRRSASLPGALPKPRMASRDDRQVGGLQRRAPTPGRRRRGSRPRARATAASASASRPRVPPVPERAGIGVADVGGLRGAVEARAGAGDRAAARLAGATRDHAAGCSRLASPARRPGCGRAVADHEDRALDARRLPGLRQARVAERVGVEQELPQAARAGVVGV